MSDTAPHIGTLREGSLHASLKQLYADPCDGVEVAVDGFVVDVVRDDLLIEVQTSGFSSLKPKLSALLDGGHRVRVVHPIAADKWIVKVDADGDVISRRRSPKHGTVLDIFSELVSVVDSLAHPRLEIDVLLTEEEEHRRHTPGRAWRRNGWTIFERRLLRVVDGLVIGGPGDLAELLPPDLPDPFTTADLASMTDRPRRTAQQMAYCLRSVGVIAVAGKTGNAIEYVIV